MNVRFMMVALVCPLAAAFSAGCVDTVHAESAQLDTTEDDNALSDARRPRSPLKALKGRWLGLSEGALGGNLFDLDFDGEGNVTLRYGSGARTPRACTVTFADHLGTITCPELSPLVFGVAQEGRALLFPGDSYGIGAAFTATRSPF